MEHPKRPLRIWSLDVGKQGTGMLAAHLCGMGAAILLAHIPFHQRSSECAWYVFTFLFDTCIGTGLSLALHWAALWAAARPSAPPALSPLLRALTPCGDYGEPASALRWVSQTLEWVFCVVLARGACLGLAAAFSPLLGRLAVHLDAAFEGRPRLFLVFVMLICPLLVNTAQVGCWKCIEDWYWYQCSRLMRPTVVQVLCCHRPPHFLPHKLLFQSSLPGAHPGRLFALDSGP